MSKSETSIAGWAGLEIPVCRPREHRVFYDDMMNELRVSFMERGRSFVVNLPGDAGRALNLSPAAKEELVQRAWEKLQASSPWAGYMTMWEAMCR